MNELTVLVDMFKSDMKEILTNIPVLVNILIFLGIATYTDLKSMKIYNKMNLIFLLTRIVFIFIPKYNLEFNIYNLLGGIIAAAIFMIPAMMLMHKMAGDIKLIFVLGLFLRVPCMLMLICLSCMGVAIYSVIMKFVFKKDNVLKTLVPFAPFFAISLIIMFILTKVYIV